ncbi:hypothetical protein D3C83_231710 [compost metagenome]
MSKAWFGNGKGTSSGMKRRRLSNVGVPTEPSSGLMGFETCSWKDRGSRIP